MTAPCMPLLLACRRRSSSGRLWPWRGWHRQRITRSFRVTTNLRPADPEVPIYASRADALTSHHIRDKSYWPAQRLRLPNSRWPARRLQLAHLAKGPNPILLACTQISTAASRSSGAPQTLRKTRRIFAGVSSYFQPTLGCADDGREIELLGDAARRALWI